MATWQKSYQAFHLRSATHRSRFADDRNR